MEAGAEEAALVNRIVGPVAAALRHHERIRKDAGEAGKGLLVFGLLAGRIDQVGITRAGIGRHQLPARRRIQVQAGEARNVVQLWRRFIVGAQIGGIAVAVMGGILREAPVVQRLRLARHVGDHGRTEIHRGMGADAGDEFAHLHGFRLQQADGPGVLRRRQVVEHRLQFRDRPDGTLIMQDAPDHGQILGADLHAGGDGGQGRALVTQLGAPAIAPGGFEIGRIVGGRGLVEGHDAADGVAVAVAVHLHQVRREIQAIGRQHHVIGNDARGLQILVQQRRRHGEGFAGIVEARLVGGIHGELAGDLHVLAGQVAHGVIVFGVGQPARQHDAGIPRVTLDLAVPDAFDPGDDFLLQLFGRLRHLPGRHFLCQQALAHQLPAREVGLDLVQAVIGLDVELRGGHGAGVAAGTIFGGKRHHRVVEALVQIGRIRCKGRRGPQGGQGAGENGKTQDFHRKLFCFFAARQRCFPTAPYTGAAPDNNQKFEVLTILLRRSMEGRGSGQKTTAPRTGAGRCYAVRFEPPGTSPRWLRSCAGSGDAG